MQQPFIQKTTITFMLVIIIHIISIIVSPVSNLESTVMTKPLLDASEGLLQTAYEKKSLFILSNGCFKANNISATIQKLLLYLMFCITPTVHQVLEGHHFRSQ
jgi:hypothetical protein